MASMEPLNRMVRMVARAFYDDVSLVRDPKSARGDNCGLAVVVLDALTSFFEEEKLVRRCHRREAINDERISSASNSLVVSSEVHLVPTNVTGKVKMTPYCRLHYAQVYDVTLYRIHEMKKKLKDELDESYMIQNYVCPNCERRYSSLDALDLNCFKTLEILLGEEGGMMVIMQEEIGRQMEPLISQMNKVKDLDFPQFQTLETWERNIRENANGDDVSTPMLFLGEVMVSLLSS
uniref:Transcription initiation factor IIE subunit alpha N-terminal domain-containing protein n=1 Tax=Oryza punctata TaxID=4537 RepID=A0A0E0MJD1_ORYPU